MKQLDPKAMWLFFITYLMWILPIFAFLLGMGLLSAVDENRVTVEPLSTLIALTPFALLALVLAGWLWAKYSYKYYKYEMREDGFRKEYGIIWKKYSTIPYGRIQNVDIYRGLIARLLGLSDLQIQTAGGLSSGSYGAFSEGRLPGLDRATAEKLRDELVGRVQGSKGQGL